MNIAILAAGAGDMLCGSCLRDTGMAAALKRLGHSVTLIPLYTPLKTDGDDLSIADVYYGGLNVYLQHATAVFRHTPRAVDWLLDRRWLLRKAGNWGAQTTPNSVADLTAGIIQGEDGPGRKELHRLIDFLERDVRPQVVNIPNLMFIGTAGAIRKRLGVPVVCELTGEDIFLDAMTDANRSRLRELIRARAGDVTRFVSTTHYYARQMADYLGITPDRIDVIPTGLPPEFFTPVVPRDRSGDRPRTVGYMARICPEKGLDQLIDAMLLLRERPGFSDVRLVAAGYLGPRDRKWYDALKSRIDASPLRDAFEYRGEVDREGKIRMLDSIDLLSVPTAYPEAKGIYTLEAMARGAPVVQPDHGSFPEIIAQTGGGLLVPPGDAGALADALRELLSNPARCDEFARAGRAAVERDFTEQHIAAKMVGVYEALL